MGFGLHIRSSVRNVRLRVGGLLWGQLVSCRGNEECLLSAISERWRTSTANYAHRGVLGGCADSCGVITQACVGSNCLPQYLPDHGACGAMLTFVKSEEGDISRFLFDVVQVAGSGERAIDQTTACRFRKN